MIHALAKYSPPAITGSWLTEQLLKLKIQSLVRTCIVLVDYAFVKLKFIWSVFGASSSQFFFFFSSQDLNCQMISRVCIDARTQL